MLEVQFVYVFIILLIYSLFSHAISTSDCILQVVDKLSHHHYRKHSKHDY
jgi:hypothetical protein